MPRREGGWNPPVRVRAVGLGSHRPQEHLHAYVDDKHLHWVAEIAGTHEEWDAEIVDQVPDQRIAWRATTGTTTDGVVTFELLGAHSTRVILDLDVEPEGLKEKIMERSGLTLVYRRGTVGHLW